MMEMKNSLTAGAEVFKLTPADVEHLFIRSGLVGNKLSPFRYNAEQKVLSKPSQWFTSLSENPVFHSISQLLLEPGLKIHYHSGGSAAVDEQYFALLSAADPHVMALFTNSREEYVMLYFSDWVSYLQWWINVYSTEGSSNYEQISSAESQIETLVCALHCIDFYRRTYMESMLDFRSKVDISIHTHDFIQLLKNSLASSDTRWLLPCLFELTPGLKNMSIALKPEHLLKIEKEKFVQCNEDLMLTLDERSKAVGTEFLMTWMGAVGWQATALINDEESALSHVFMAPTAFANHLFSFETETDAKGSSRFRHQACKRTDLINVLSVWMDALRKVTHNEVILAVDEAAAAADEVIAAADEVAPDAPAVQAANEDMPTVDISTINEDMPTVDISTINEDIPAANEAATTDGNVSAADEAATAVNKAAALNEAARATRVNRVAAKINRFKMAVDGGAATATEVPQGNICGKCGEQSRPGKRFCTSCGALMADVKRGEHANG